MTEANPSARPPRPRWVWPVVGTVAAVALIGGTAFGIYLYASQADKRGDAVRPDAPTGKLVVEAEVPEAELILKRDGDVVRDRTRQREMTLPVGKYTVELAEPDGLQVTPDQVEVTRDGAAKVQVRRAKK